MMKTVIMVGAAAILALTFVALAIWNPAADRFGPNRSPRLDRRDRVELVARLWVA